MGSEKVVFLVIFIHPFENSGGYFFRGRLFWWILDINLQNFVRGYFSKFSLRALKEQLNGRRAGLSNTIQLGIPDYSNIIKKPMDLGTIVDQGALRQQLLLVRRWSNVRLQPGVWKLLHLQQSRGRHRQHAKMAKLPEGDEVALHEDDLLHPVEGSEDDTSDDDFP